MTTQPAGPSPLTHRNATAAAFFDLDKTILAKSSSLMFARPFYRNGLIGRADVLRSAYAQFVFEFLDLHTECRLRHEAFFGGGDKTFISGYCDNIF